MKEKQETNFFDRNLKYNQGGFKMPDAYGDNLENILLHKIEETEKKTRLIKRLNCYYSSMTAAAILLIFFLIMQPQNLTQNQALSYDDVSWDQFAYIDETWMLEELASTEVYQNSNISDEIDFLIDSGVSSDEIIETMGEDIR